MSKARVFLAEDDLQLGFVIKDNLEEQGYTVSHFRDGQSAIDQFDKKAFDICLLDIMMPLKDGFAVAKKIRQQSDLIPILFLTARSMQDDKLKGFQTGADDYITKPFSMTELLLRMEVFLRRTKMMYTEAARIYQVGKLEFNYSEMKLQTPEGRFNLSQREAELLRFLCEHPNRVLKREEVLMQVWGKNDYFLGRSMDVFMARLRKYIKQDDSLLLETIHGVGFRLSTDSRTAS